LPRARGGVMVEHRQTIISDLRRLVHAVPSQSGEWP